MIIKTLMENTKIDENLACEHGLSLYIETGNLKILFDMGASGLFAENAEKMNVDLAQVDVAVISHGHYDHGGGLETFMKLNSKAMIYINKSGFEGHYALSESKGYEYIGLPSGIENSKRIVFVENEKKITEEIILFSNVKGNKFYPKGNDILYKEKSGAMIIEDFSHEQNLIIKENNISVLFAGCAHKGIINIIEHIEDSGYGMADYVVGGFHLYNRADNKDQDETTVKQIGEYLKSTKAKYFTGHCTGIESYEVLKKIMKDKIEYIGTGSHINI